MRKPILIVALTALPVLLAACETTGRDGGTRFGGPESSTRVVVQPSPNTVGSKASPRTEAAFEPDAAADIMGQLADLREDVERLQDTLDRFLGLAVSDLQDENSRLRREVERVRAEQKTEEARRPFPPRPKATSPPRFTNNDEEPDGPAPVSDGAPYSIVMEWGRTPVEVGAWDGRVSSLKGMVCVVPEGTSDEALIQFGRELRAKFDAYDNINIDVFNDETAARKYAETHTADTQHQVLSISRERASGRDLILLHRGDTVEVISTEE